MRNWKTGQHIPTTDSEEYPTGILGGGNFEPFSREMLIGSRIPFW